MNPEPITYSSLVALNMSAFPNLSFYSNGFSSMGFNLRSFHQLRGDLDQDYYNCVFRILPVLNYKTHDELIDQLYKLSFMEFEQNEQKSRKQTIQNFLLNLENELTSNISLTNKLAGTPLVFSSSVFHLVHVSSLKFLALDDQNLEAIQFKLVDFPNENTLMKFNPCLNFQKLRTNVVYSGDVVCISASKQVCNRTANLFTDYWGVNYYELNEEPQKYEDEVAKAKVIASVEDSTQWRIKIFQKNQVNEDTLFVGDVAIFTLPELNLFLNAQKTTDIQETVKDILENNIVDDFSLIPENKNFPLIKQQTLFPNPQIQISRQVSEEVGREIPNQSNAKSESISNAFEKQKSMQSRSSQIVPTSKNIKIIDKLLNTELKVNFNNLNIARNDKAQIPFSAYWRIESDNFIGGEVIWDKCYRIRHFQTGQYLDINVMRQVKLTEQVQKSSLFYFIPVKKNSKFINKDSYFQIRHFQTGCYLDIKYDAESPDGSITTTNEIKFANSIKFRKTEFEEVWEKRFLLFLIPILKEAISYFEITQPPSSIAYMKRREVQERIQFYYLFEKLSSMLDVLNQFILNKLVSNIQTTQDFSFLSHSRQNIIREENVLPLLIWLICKTFPASEEKMEDTLEELNSHLEGEYQFILRVQALLQLKMEKSNDIEQEKKVQKLKYQLEENHRKRKRLLQLKLMSTLKILCQHNSKNQIVLMKYFKSFEKHITLDYVCSTIISCISQNYQLLYQLNRQEQAQNFDMKNTIMMNSQADSNRQKNTTSSTNTILQRLVDILSNHDQQLSELMRLLSTSCEANGEPIFPNQEYLLTNVIQDDKMQRRVLIPLVVSLEEGGYQEFHLTYKSANKTYKTDKLHTFLGEKSNQENPFFNYQYEFLIQQLALYSSISFHRNTAAREVISKQFSYSNLLSYAQDSQIDTRVRAQFFRMIRILYIDREPFTTAPKPELVRILEDKTTQQQLFLFDEIQSQKSKSTDFDIQKLKEKMLTYLQEQYFNLCQCQDYEVVYSLLTLEIIKILEMILKFELFWKLDGMPNVKKNSNRRGMSVQERAIRNTEGVNEIDRLITYLAKILEYDHQYFKCLDNAKIKRNWEIDGEKKKTLKLNINITGISQVFDNENKQKVQFAPQQFVKQDTEVVNDPLFKKMKNLRKVLQNYNNKTFTLRENKEEDFEVLIKIQICSIFSYLMDVSQDYWIDNALNVYKNQIELIKLSNNEEITDVTKLFPDEILISGEQFTIKNENEKKTHSSQTILKNFDEVLKRPFIEVLLISLYFTRNPQLENQIVELIQRFARQKKEFLQHFDNIQILDTNESQQLFNVWIQMTQLLKNNIQRSQMWITDNKKNRLMDQTLQCLWKIDSIFQQSESVSLKLKQQIYEHIGGYEVLIELIDKGLNVIDQKSFYPELITLLKHSMSIMAYFSKDNERNALVVYKKVVKKVIEYYNQNIGQITLICSLFEKKPTLYGQLGDQEYNYFIQLIKQHGRYPEFLQFYQQILEVTEIYSKKSAEIYEIVLEKLTEQEYIQDQMASRQRLLSQLYPFQEGFQNSTFFDYKPNIQKYQQLFINIISKCISKNIRASLISQAIEFLRLEDILDLIKVKTQKILQFIKQRERPNDQDVQLQSSLWNIIKTMIITKQEYLDQLMERSNQFIEILKLEYQAIIQKDQFIPTNLNYLFDSLLPVVNRYNELLQNALLSSERDQLEMFQFVDFFLNNLDRMFFLAPSELTNNRQRLQTLTDLAQSFNIALPKKLLTQEFIIQQDDYTQDIQTIQHIPSINTPLNQFKKKYFSQEKIKDLVKNESLRLSNSIWNIQKMFKNDKKNETKDLLLTNSDIIVKILSYLEFWRTNNASRENVVFILNVLSAILKDTEEDELYHRQILFDKMNVTQILIVLLCESELEPTYMGTLMKFLILLLTNGNIHVQKTAYEYFLNNSQCEKLFKQFKDVFDIQILSMSRAHKLNAHENKLVYKTLKVIQLFCEGHNYELQNYMRTQHNQKNSYDLVTQIVLLLHTFQISKANYESVLQCFETLTELIQGPCRSNQQALIKSNLIEYTVQILKEDEKLFEQSNEYLNYRTDKQYKIAIHPGYLARLKFKCLNCLVSLLEGCDQQNSDIARMVRVLPLSILTQNLSRIYQLFKKYSESIYKDDLFKRMEEEITDEKNPEYYELIIENGFYIVLIIQQFLGNQKAKSLLDEDTETSEFLNEFNDNNKKEENAIANIFEGIGKFAKMGENLIGQIGQQQKTEEELRQEQLIKEKMEQKELTKNAIKFFRTNTCSIDIIRDQKLYTIYFPKLPICNLPKQPRSEFHDQVDRTSSKTKLTFLMERSNFLIKVMEYEEKLNQFFALNPVFGFFATQGKLWENCAFITTLAINLIVLFSYSQSFYIEGASGDQGDLFYERLSDPRLFEIQELTWTTVLIQALGIVMLVFSSLIVFFFIVKRAPLKVDRIWENYHPSQRFIITFCDILIRGIKSLFILLQDTDILYYCIYIIAGIVGLTVHPFFFAFHLMDFLKLEQLKTVLDAIWGPRVEIGLALLLLTVFEYYVGILGYVIFFSDYPVVNNVGCKILEGNDYIVCERGCSTMWQCVFMSFDQTFKYTGSLGAGLMDYDTVTRISQNYDMVEDAWEKLQLANNDYDGVDHIFTTNYFGRFFFDNAINIMLVLIMLNMIQGIIVDTFGSLRERLQERIKDQTMKCFICGIMREKFEKNDEAGMGFTEHIRYEHYMWNYIYYYAYLKHKDPNDYNGNESYVNEKIEIKDISWMPIKRARIAEEEQDDQQKTQEVQEQIQSKMKNINDSLEKIYCKQLNK